MLGLLLAFGLWSLRFFGEKGPVHAAEWWVGDLALASVFVMPALVGLYASLRRPALLLSAGILSLVLSVALLVSVVTFPLVVPGVLYLVAYRRRDARGEARAALVTPILIASAAAALILLIFAPRTVVCWHEKVYADGRTVLTRDEASERASGQGMFSQQLGPPAAGVVSESSGCTDGVFPPSRSLGALGVVVGGLLIGLRLSG